MIICPACKHSLDAHIELSPEDRGIRRKCVVESCTCVLPTSNPISPQHYQQHPSGVECIRITEHMNFCLGNAVKYIWRAGLKADAVEDLKKARWYLDREIQRLENV